ncbi:LuxR C-terminal-related transcriptional regulator [Mycobacterium simiae]|uniref:LuxR C-terminal-related transcriptional regulator n=1 Tax=Mycobacterium simiae TaxID=1784 RepID=UPI0026140509|nr:LuxR C-terminal-related transcriptional regulator [Mycobacterium simiae]
MECNPADGESPLTELLARDGYPNSQLLISPRTVQWHSGRILAKLGVTSRWEQRARRPRPIRPRRGAAWIEVRKRV